VSGKSEITALGRVSWFLEVSFASIQVSRK